MNETNQCNCRLSAISKLRIVDFTKRPRRYESQKHV